MINKRHFLTEKEYNALNKLAKSTKMDTWFYICESPEAFYIYDLEDDKIYDLRSGISMLVEGLTSTNSSEFGLSDDETVALNVLFVVMNIQFGFNRFVSMRHMLNKLVERSYELYRYSVLASDKTNIYDSYYETTWKNEAMQILLNNEFNNDEAMKLIEIDGKYGLLDFIYREWLAVDYDSVGELREMIRDIAVGEYDLVI